jgi:thioredoxin-like negative regulator of GroEL
MKPVVDGLTKRYAGKIEIRRMDTDGSDPQVAQLADALGIQYVPTFVFVNSDGTVTATVVGEVSESRLVEELAKLR